MIIPGLSDDARIKLFEDWFNSEEEFDQLNKEQAKWLETYGEVCFLEFHSFKLYLTYWIMLGNRW